MINLPIYIINIIMNLEPPPTDETYLSLPTLITAVNEFAGPQGYAVVKRRTKNSKKGEIRKAWLGCDRGKEFKAEGFGKRQHGTSRRIDCKFEAIAMRGLDDSWHLSIKEPSHNHEATLAVSHPILRKFMMTSRIKQSIETQSTFNVAPQKILAGLRAGGDDEHPMILARDIYNAKAVIKRRKLGPLTPLQALFRNLEHDENWFYKHEVDENNQVRVFPASLSLTNGANCQLKYLFFSKTSSHLMMKDNWEVLLMNCTYKTNKFKMPLCIITGITSLNTTFYVAFCFMSEEHADDYLWLLQQLALLYIHIDVSRPKVVITDGEKGLISSIHKVFPGTVNLLCI